MTLFRLLLSLFPRGFRETFGEDMRAVFAAQLRAARASDRRGAVARLWLRTATGMTAAAWRERRAGRSSARRSLPYFETFASDVRLAVRMLSRAPLFAAVVVAAVSIGIGAVATIFSAVNAIMLRPLPGTSDGDRLVGIERRTADRSEGVSASVAYYTALREHTRSLQGVAAWSRVALTLSRGGEGIAVTGNIVSANYFSVLGVQPAAGRFFAADDDRAAAAEPAVVVSHAFWKARFGADPSVVGGPITVNGRPYRLIGVAPDGFHGVFTPIRIDAWVPLAMQPHLRPGRDLAQAPWLWLFGRLGDGVTSAQAHSELSALTASWIAGGGDQYPRYTNTVITPLTGLPDDARRALMGFGAMLLGAAGLVLLIAAANVSSLLAARATSRRREMGVRVALGAGRWRLVRQILTETLALFLLGALGGTLLAAAATAALERLPLPADAALSLELSPDLRVLALAIGLALFVGLVFGAGPALRGSGRNPVLLLRASSAAAGRRTFVSSGLMVAQMACSLVLLAAAGLFVRSLGAGAAIDPGFDPGHVVVAAFNTESYGYGEPAGRTFYDSLRRRLEAIPGVRSVSSSNIVPVTMSSSGDTVSIERTAGGSAEKTRLHVENAVVDTGYFDTLRLPLVAGRDFTSNDRREAAEVAIVNETFARKAWPDGDAIGRTFESDGARVTIVGIARDAKYETLDEPPVAFVYLPVAQHWQNSRTVFVRAEGGAAAIASAIVEQVRSIDPSLPRPVVTPLESEMRVALLPQRVAAIVTGVLGAVGLLLACIGLYGIVAYGVSLRSREIGVRMALGARGSDVVKLVIRRGVRLTAAGAGIGLVAAALATRVISGYLLRVGPLDLPAFGGAIVLLSAVALVAMYVPARRAAAADPLVALRTE